MWLYALITLGVYLLLLLFGVLPPPKRIGEWFSHWLLKEDGIVCVIVLGGILVFLWLFLLLLLYTDKEDLKKKLKRVEEELQELEGEDPPRPREGNTARPEGPRPDPCPEDPSRSPSLLKRPRPFSDEAALPRIPGLLPRLRGEGGGPHKPGPALSAGW